MRNWKTTIGMPDITDDEIDAVTNVLKSKWLTMGAVTKKFEKGLKDLGFEIIESDHPIVPLMIRDTDKTSDLVNYLFSKGVLSTGLNYPVVPKLSQTFLITIFGNL